MLRYILVPILLMAALTTYAQQEKLSDEQLVAIASDGKEVTASVADLPGVAPYFHIYSMSGKALKVVANPYLGREFGTGPRAAAMLAEEGVDHLIGYKVPGPKMMDVLDANDIQISRFKGTVEQVVEELQRLSGQS